MSSVPRAGEPCENCGRLVYTDHHGQVEYVPGSPGVSLMILHDAARCREARRSNVITDAKLLAVSMSPDWLPSHTHTLGNGVAPLNPPTVVP